MPSIGPHQAQSLPLYGIQATPACLVNDESYCLGPAVTRVEQPLREASALAVETLFGIIDARREGRPDPELIQKLIPPTLAVRSSC